MNRLFFIILILVPTFAMALTSEERLQEPAQEARAHELFKQIRCVVCSGESVNDSNADIAQQMRILIRDKIKSGNSDKEIIDSIVNAYGESVLMSPPLNQATYVLWFGPAIAFLVGIVVMFFFFRRKR